MKYILIAYCLFVSITSVAQQPAAAAKGVTYGVGSAADGAIQVMNWKKI